MVGVAAVTPVVGTYLTIRGAELQHVEDMLFLQRIHELFLVDRPSERTGPESTPSFVRRELVGTVVTERELGEILVVVVVFGLAYPTGTPVFAFTGTDGRGGFGTRTELVDVEHIVRTAHAFVLVQTVGGFITGQCRHVVLAESAVVAGKPLPSIVIVGLCVAVQHWFTATLRNIRIPGELGSVLAPVLVATDVVVIVHCTAQVQPFYPRHIPFQLQLGIQHLAVFALVT